MKFSGKRTLLALLLVALAVIVPGAAWYVAGSRELERQIGDLSEASQQEAQETARRLANQLTQRLSALLEAEAKRPFYHYQAYFHDPKGASEGAAVSQSPLASSPGDPLIELYFQADGASGRVTLPGAEGELQQYDRAEAKHQRTDEQLFLQRQLERGLASILVTVRGESKAVSKASARQAFGQRVDELDKTAWEQNVSATQLYANLKTRVPIQQTITNETGTVQIFVGPMKWRTVYIANDPSLVALREVTTPRGAVLQGFLLSSRKLGEYLKAAGLPARLAPGRPVHDYQAAVVIGDEPWRIALDVSAAHELTNQQTRELRRAFFIIFIGGVAIATVAGLGVVWLVWHSDRLARQRSQFAASAAHELRTPLAGLRIYSDMLAEGLGDPGKTKDYATRVAAEADRLGRVVANVLSFTRLERGTLKTRPTTGDLAGTVRECISRQRPALEAAGAKLEAEIADELPAVKFDRDALAEILENLLDNAEKHTRHAGNRTVHLALASANGAIELTVRDHGPGIPGEVRRHLFEAFARGRDNEAPAGLGLGLVLVKALAEGQGAQVDYADAPGGGAQFTVTFPA